MALTDIPFKAGIFTEDTDRGVGKLFYWKDCDHVRFFNGRPQKIGGNVKATETQLLGKARSLIDWVTTQKEYFIAVGTHKKLYLFGGGLVSDITPIRASGTLTDPFGTTSGLTSVVVTDTAHGLSAGDFVHYTGASAVGGITISGEYEVTIVNTINEYVIEHSVAASSTTSGGGSVDYQYEISIGTEYESISLGWGAGEWDIDTWGTPRDSSTLSLSARIWSLGVWGEDLIASPYDGAIYVWDASAGVTTRATLISQAPSTNKAIFVSQDERIIVALGANDGVAPDAQLIRWCNQEDYTDWVPALSNTAGDKRLELGTEIYGAVAARTETVVYTNTALYSMSFVGAPDMYAFQPLGLNGGIAGPRAMTTFNGICYWMAVGGFYKYDGTIIEIPCAVYSHVFGDINATKLKMSQAATIIDFSEIMWLYASADSVELDRYVIFNTVDASWYYGTFNRTLIAGTFQNDMHIYGCSPEGYLYRHETGVDDDGAALEAHLYSGDIEVGDSGEYMMRISKFIADMVSITGTLNITFSGKKYPQDTETQESGPHAITSATPYINPRIRCRQISLQFESSELHSNWRMGPVRIDAKPDGKR